MNVKRFTGRTSRDALKRVREAFGEDAVVLSTKPCDEGVAVLAMAPGGLEQIDRHDAASGGAAAVAAAAGAPRPGQRRPAAGHDRATPPAMPRTPADVAKPPAAGRGNGGGNDSNGNGGSNTVPAGSSGASALAARARALFAAHRPAAPAGIEPALGAPAEPGSSMAEDVDKLAMSTLSFQDYVRERMLRRRDAELKAAAETQAREQEEQASRSHLSVVMASRMAAGASAQADPAPARPAPAQPSLQSPPPARPRAAPPRHEPPVLRDEVRLADPTPPAAAQPAAAPHAAVRGMPQPTLADTAFHGGHGQHGDDGDLDVAAAHAGGRRGQPGNQHDMLNELRSMKGLIEERFGALAFMEKLQRQPAQARLTQRLLDCGFSPALIRKLSESLSPGIADETAWAVGVLERNLHTAEAESALEDQGGVYALIGATGVGKTTTTAKLAAAFATRYGAANLGLITLDAYRVGAHEQLRAYGRILGVTVHTAHDRASLEDLLELLAAKKMVLIDTAGMAQRDSRTAELLEMMNHRSIRKLLVVNAAAQGETIEDVLIAYRASQCRGIVLSKMDEAVKLGPALDALIRHRLTVVGVANGQRVPEDWHRLSSHALVHKAMRPAAGPAWRMDASDVGIVFAAPHGAPLPHGAPSPQGSGLALPA